MNAIVLQLESVTDTDTRTTLNQEFERPQSQLLDVEFIYNPYETDRVSKQFDFVVHFLNRDFGIY